MVTLAKTWKLDPRLEADTLPVSTSDLFETRLMNDKRWPWLIVVPVGQDMFDIDDYSRTAFDPLMQHLSDISSALKVAGLATSTNVATIGNIVRQMHWHVVGRNVDDPNWPNPVWGFGERVPYTSHQAADFIQSFQKAFRG